MSRNDPASHDSRHHFQVKENPISNERNSIEELRILVVDDDSSARERMGKHLRTYRPEFAVSLHEAVQKLETENYDICFIDLRLGKEDQCSGLKLVPLAASRGIYAVVMSGLDSEDIVQQAYEHGCNDFYEKGNEAANVGDVIAKYRERKEAFSADNFFSQRFVTNDPATKASVLAALKYAPMDIPLFILGPSGTGKTNLAALLHERSKRRGEFVSMNCSAYSEELLEAELFGFKKGAFTGAHENREGKLAQADKGTLFLDEIGSMSLNMQTKLLKAIEERTFFPVGSSKVQSSDFRIISATLEEPKRLLDKNRLRFDFFQRIHGFMIKLKPLAQRPDDILPLVHFFSRGKRRLSFSPEAKTSLLLHPWPGNIRELKRFVELLLSGGEGRVDAEAARRHLSASLEMLQTSDFLTEGLYRHALDHGLQPTVDRLVSEIIRRKLEENDGNKSQTQRDLKISTRLFYATVRRVPRLPDAGAAGDIENQEA